MGPRGSADPTHEGRAGLPPVRDFSPGRRHRQHAEAGSADPTREGRDGLPPVRDSSPRRRHRQHADAGPRGQMGPRGSAAPTHEGRDGLPPVRDFSPGRRHRQHAEAGRVDRWGRAAARTLPTGVGTGCRPSVTSPRVGGIGSTPKRAAWTRDPGHDRLRLRRRCAMPHTSRATRPHGAQLRATSVDVSATSNHTRAVRAP